MDTIYTSDDQINDLEKLLRERFPMGTTRGREFFTQGLVLDRRRFRVNLDTGAWINLTDPEDCGDTIVSLLAKLDHNGDEAAAEGATRRRTAPPPDAEWWLIRDLEAPEPLLGEVITTTSRTFIGGPTGIGKSHLALAMAAGMATGCGFAHWTASRAVRTLYVDGEMPRDLVQSLLRDLKARMDGADLSNLLVLCWEDFEEIAPFNTDPGAAFILARVQDWGAEATFLDNRMSLTSGDMKDEFGWSATVPLVKELSRRRVAQVWLDHTGHEASRIYGTKTKEWSFDNVALLTKVERPDAAIAFQLEFTKARRRRPATRADFATVTFTLAGDQWTTDAAPAADKAKLSPMCRQFYLALMEAFIDTPACTTKRAWYGQCVRLGLAEAIEPEDTYQVKRTKQASFRKYLGQLRAAWLIGVDGETVNDLRNRAP